MRRAAGALLVASFTACSSRCHNSAESPSTVEASTTLEGGVRVHDLLRAPSIATITTHDERIYAATDTGVVEVVVDRAGGDPHATVKRDPTARALTDGGVTGGGLPPILRQSAIAADRSLYAAVELRPLGLSQNDEEEVRETSIVHVEGRHDREVGHVGRMASVTSMIAHAGGIAWLDHKNDATATACTVHTITPSHPARARRGFRCHGTERLLSNGEHLFVGGNSGLWQVGAESVTEVPSATGAATSTLTVSRVAAGAGRVVLHGCVSHARLERPQCGLSELVMAGGRATFGPVVELKHESGGIIRLAIDAHNVYWIRQPIPVNHGVPTRAILERVSVGSKRVERLADVGPDHLLGDELLVTGGLLLWVAIEKGSSVLRAISTEIRAME